MDQVKFFKGCLVEYFVPDCLLTLRNCVRLDDQKLKILKNNICRLLATVKFIVLLCWLPKARDSRPK